MSTVLKFMKKGVVIYFIILVIINTSCTRYPKDVRIALNEAGTNRKELETVLKHYRAKQEDSLKLKAAYFLISNMPDQYYIEGQSLDVYIKEISKMQNKSVENLINLWDSIQFLYPNDFIIKRDIDIIDAELLIENIDMAFISWSAEWNKSLSFEEFCEYLLPYKSANEKPEKGWRKNLLEKYKWLLDSVENKNSPLDLCIAVNSEFKKWYKLNLDYQYPVDLGYDMYSKIESGSCDMGAKAILYPMRALGIPVTYDYAPFWANRNQQHNWNSVIQDGLHKTFNGGDNDVGSHKVEYIGVGRMMYKPAKILRRTYSVQKNTLPYFVDEHEEIPKVFKNKRILDVTEKYIPTSDIHLVFSGDPPYYCKTGYLCTFNNKDWQIYYWGIFKNQEIIFENMGRDVAYLPVIYRNEKIIPIGDPFILTKDGKISICKADPKRKQLIKVMKKYPEDESNNIFPGETYELLYWQNGWVSLGLQVADTNYLIYENAPVNALFWIRNHTQGVQERIFTYLENKQIWW